QISDLSDSSAFASGGKEITISGSNLADATAVMFVVPPAGGNPATSVTAASFTINDDGSITAIVPAWPTQLASATTADIRVVTPEGTTGVSAADRITLTPAGAIPTVTALSVPTASTSGGQMVTITGTNFTDVTGVQFVVPPSGSNPGTSVPARLFYV